ncbi:MAG: hypothetical protein JST89_26345 [Cyanobacteria bacterium SZAS-4]|nr:hypothetical protein [Cyanobacteria bacterium SZAS-4]
MRILVANDLQGFKRLTNALRGQDIRFVQTLSEAKQVLETVKFDLIIAGVHFDDSRAVELLQEVRTSRKVCDTPLVFVRTRSSSLANEIKRTLANLQKVYHHNGLVETDAYQEDDLRIRAALLSTLNTIQN